MKRLINTSNTTIVDHETGEIKKSIHTNVSVKESEPQFVKLYVDDVGRLMNLSPSGSKVLNMLVKNMNYYNMVTLVKPVKEMMCAELKISLKTFENEKDKLYQKGLIIRKARSLYIIDPELFGKGKWENVKKIRMIVEYDEKGNKFINTELVKQLEIDF